MKGLTYSEWKKAVHKDIRTNTDMFSYEKSSSYGLSLKSIRRRIARKYFVVKGLEQEQGNSKNFGKARNYEG